VENAERIVERSLNDLAKIYAFTGQYDSTIFILKKTSFGKESLLMAFALKESGKKAEAKKIVELNRKKTNDRPDPLLPVKLSILDGNYDEAASTFLKADESRFIRVLFDDPIFLKIKDRPEIRSILEKKEARNKEMIKAIEDNKIVIE
jgi:hypothetical protein